MLLNFHIAQQTRPGLTQRQKKQKWIYVHFISHLHLLSFEHNVLLPKILQSRWAWAFLLLSSFLLLRK